MQNKPHSLKFFAMRIEKNCEFLMDFKRGGGRWCTEQADFFSLLNVNTNKQEEKKNEKQSMIPLYTPDGGHEVADSLTSFAIVVINYF